MDEVRPPELRRIQLTTTVPGRRRRRADPFIAIHIPLAWAVAAAHAGAGDVAWAVLFHYGLAQRAAFTASAADLAVTCASEDAARRQFQRLEQAGLVRVERLPGRKPTITVMTTQPNQKDAHD